MATMAELESATSGVTGRRSDQLSYMAIWQGREGSNLQPSVLETAALPIELLPYI